MAGAARAFSAAGFDATSMEDIAEAAGVTKLILYRHFESKEELYRSIVEQVSQRLQAEIDEAMTAGLRRRVIAPAFLRVAREDPDGFRLLWVHAAREPRFAAYSKGVHIASVDFARRLLARRVTDPLMLEWASALSVDFLVQSVLAWLDRGDPEQDARFEETTTRSLEALVGTWATA